MMSCNRWKFDVWKWSTWTVYGVQPPDETNKRSLFALKDSVWNNFSHSEVKGQNDVPKNHTKTTFCPRFHPEEEEKPPVTAASSKVSISLDNSYWGLVGKHHSQKSLCL